VWRPWETVTDLEAGAEALRRRACGMIEVVDGRLRRVLLRPLPKLTSALEAVVVGGFYHKHCRGDRVRLYYQQPWRFPNFLVLKYVVSTRQAGFAAFSRALAVLDEIARLKQSDALLCDVGNGRISDRLMSRWGWVRHCPSRWHRNYIKRFYGRYPPRPGWLAAQ
jgi:hypothetical protein